MHPKCLGKEKCVETTKVSKVKVEENLKSVVFLNPDKQVFSRWRVDGCLVSNTCACDWFVVRNGEAGILIELKGCDVAHALVQIESSFTLIAQFGLTCARMAAIIVCRNPPSHPRFTSKLQRARNSLAKNFRAPLHVFSHNPVITVESALKHV